MSDKNVHTITKQMQTKELKEGVDYFHEDYFMNDIFPLVAYYRFEDVFINLIQLSVTERCTLKCLKCAHACYNVDFNSKDMLIEDAKKSADCFFEKVDYAGEFVLIGGEPFLYKDLYEIIEYIGENYRKMIGIFSITTNGTIVPSNEILYLCKKWDILLRISNYSSNIPALEKKYNELKLKTDAMGINYILGDADAKWFDYGFGHFARSPEEDLKKVFFTCNTPCREIRGNKLYYCVMARSVSENLGLDIGSDDYLNLEEIDLKNRKKILDFQLGNIEKGYLEMCRFCRGGEAKKYIIQAAEQVKR